jgi:hypothetical protein
MGAADREMFQYNNIHTHLIRQEISAAWPIAGDGLRGGARESASLPTEVKEVLAMFASGALTPTLRHDLLPQVRPEETELPRHTGGGRHDG